MLIKRSSDILSSEITDKKHYLNRRQFIQAAGMAGGAATAVATGMGVVGGMSALLRAAQPAPHGRKLENIKKSPLGVTNEKRSTWEEITTYNNYYEFGSDKDDPSMTSGKFKTQPWTVTVDGECNKKAAWYLEDILKGETLEERVYRHRCV